MKLLKIFTTRNAFSREYGTWLIVLFNLAFVPVFLQKVSVEIVIYFFSIIFFLMFRFELLDYFSIDVQFSKRSKILRASIYLFLSVGLFAILVINAFIEPSAAIIIASTGIIMIILNIATRRKKGKRQNIFAQLILVSFITFLGALNYYFLTGQLDKTFSYIFLFNTVFYANSILYVRSKTMGSPFDTIAFIFSLAVMAMVVSLIMFHLIKPAMIAVMIPTLVKTLDNVILLNIKVPLRRIGLNETIHCIIYTALFCLLY